MSVRLKILAVTVALLVLFAITTALSAMMTHSVIGTMSGMVDYHLKLSSLISELDVVTFEYELQLRRAIELDGKAPARLPEIIGRTKAIGVRILDIIKESQMVLQRASQDGANAVSDRLVFAKVNGVFTQMSKQAPPFIALGDRAMDAIREHRFQEASEISNGFATFEQVFGADLADIRRVLAQLNRESLSETRAQSGNILRLNIILFATAAVLGLSSFIALGYGLHKAFDRLIEGARKIEQGHLNIELPVTSRDEIGQLTKAFNQMIRELRGKERIKDTFGKFLDPRVVARVLSSQDESEVFAERRAVTTFFSDIQGFSGISEQLTADAMVRLLNAYFTAMTKIVREQNGIVDKYIGDAVMAFWTPPFCPGDRYAASACLASLAQQKAIAQFQSEVPNIIGLRRSAPNIHVRIGLGTGEAVVGIIGSETVRSYTVIGDTVNVAARLESANKLYGTSILACQETIRAAQLMVEAREIDVLIVAGKTEPIRVFEVLCPAGELGSEMKQVVERFGEGLAAYRKSDWDTAERKFSECLAIKPDDGPSRTFADRVSRMRNAPVRVDWNGVWDKTWQQYFAARG